MTGWQQTLKKVIEIPKLHGRFLNTLSLMEYIGSRKIMKSQQESHISEDVLAHASEEIRHALIFKKLAQKISGGEVPTYDEKFLVSSAQAKAYMQGIDRFGEKLLGVKDSFKNYLLTTYVVEKRAQSVYPWYETELAALGYPGYMKSIVREEIGHLEQMEKQIKKYNLDENVISALFAHEESLYNAIIMSLAKEADIAIVSEAANKETSI